MSPNTRSKSNIIWRVRLLVIIFITGLVLSGATAIPLVSELDWLTKFTGARQMVTNPGSTNPPAWALWLCKVQDAIQVTAEKNDFLFYGTDWLAFGHFVAALAFIGALRDPVQNQWLFTWGMLACALLVPYALIFGGVRGIPIWWRCVDCSFGVLGMIPLWLCRKWIRQIGTRRSPSSSQLVISDPWR